MDDSFSFQHHPLEEGSSQGAFSVQALPKRAGVGLKPQHYQDILETRPDIGWFEIHPENYMGEGGITHFYLSRIREHYPLSIHGVGLSIGGALPLNKDHLSRLKRLVDRYSPQSFSEHLAWSTHETGFANDLLPLPYTQATLENVVSHILEVQDTLKRPMLLENPATYITFAESTFSETDFLKEIVKRSGCGLLLDVNNVFVSATNHNYSPEAYLDAFPLTSVQEIHLAGHDTQQDDFGLPLLIDTHDRAVAKPVWTLYQRTLQKMGAVPTLIEWDTDIPEWSRLFEEAQKAERCLSQVAKPSVLL